MTEEQGKNAAINAIAVNNGVLVWIGVGVGAALGVAFALSRRKRDRWATARHVSRQVVNRTGDLAAASKDIVDRLKIIYAESCKVVEEAGELWSRGRKLTGV